MKKNHSIYPAYLILLWLCFVANDVFARSELCTDFEVSLIANDNQPISCFGGSNGSIEAIVIEPSEPGTTNIGNPQDYIYTWSTDPQSSGLGDHILMNLTSDDYSVTVTDMNGSTCVASIFLGQPTELSISFIHTDATCGANGSATAIIDGGTPNYSYQWSHNSNVTTATAPSLQAGTYTVIVTDGNGCMASEDIEIELTNAMSVEVSSSHVSCNGGNDGMATVTPSGGTAPYTYQWSNDITTATASNLSAGSYNVTIEDATSCSLIESIVISEPNQIQIQDIDIIHVRCQGDSDGQATVTPNGETAPYTYQWSNGTTEETASNLSAGGHTVTITDNNNCTISLTIEVTEPELLSIETVNIIPTKCHDTSDGQAGIHPTGGTAPYTYQWSHGADQMILTNLSTGDYTITITDAHDCTTTTSITITAPSVLEASVEILSHINCADATPLAEIQVSPIAGTGTPDYTITWKDGQTGEIAQYDSPGIYTVNITDANGCMLDTLAEVVLEGQPNITEPPMDVVFKNNGQQSLEYEVDLADVTLSWMIVETTNINTTVASYQTSGEVTGTSIPLTFVLEENRIPGAVLIETVPISGCEGEAVQTLVHIYPSGRPFHACEVFSPEQDEWRVIFPDSYNANDFSIEIFSRNGKKVYQSNSLHAAWDGMGCPDGPYYYIIRDEENDQQYKGAVSILR